MVAIPKTVNESAQMYSEYIDEHVANIHTAFERLFRPYFNTDDDTAYALAGVSAEELQKALETAEQNIDQHDASKYEAQEFESYRCYLLPSEDEFCAIRQGTLDAKTPFDRAYYNHYRSNPHHPTYWANDDGTPLNDMPLEYIIEMISDWEAMTIKLGGSTVGWWVTKGDLERRALTQASLDQVNRMVDVLFR